MPISLHVIQFKLDHCEDNTDFRAIPISTEMLRLRAGEGYWYTLTYSLGEDYAHL